MLGLCYLKSEMKIKNQEQLFYVARLKKMKYILLMIFGFLIALRLITWFGFPDSLIMEVVTMVNVGILMGMVLMGKWQRKNTNVRWLTIEEREILVYNCVLIFISAFIIDDVAGMVTGRSVINFNILTVFSK